jgi:hypothetical protein
MVRINIAAAFWIKAGAFTTAEVREQSQNIKIGLEIPKIILYPSTKIWEIYPNINERQETDIWKSIS